MEQCFAKIGGIQVAYTEKNPTAAQTIFFVHGNSASSRSWRNQFSSDLFSGFRLIGIDLPGHGKSQPALDPDESYNLVALGKYLSKAIQTLAINSDYIVVGSSLGTNVVAEALDFDVKPKGLVMCGPCVIGGDCTLESIVAPGADPSAVFSDDMAGKLVRKYAMETSSSRAESDINLFLEDYYLVRKPFRSSLFRSLIDGKFNDELSLISSSKISVAVIFGAEDKIINPDYLDNAVFKLWRNQIHKIPGASHLVHIDQPLAFNCLLASYSHDIFK